MLSLKILLIQIMFIGNIIKTMEEKQENIKTFDVYYTQKDNKLHKAIVRAWIEAIEDPLVYNHVLHQTYTLKGVCHVYYFEFSAGEKIIKTKGGDSVMSAFYELTEILYSLNIKMNVKGCVLGYYMIPKAQSSYKTVKLTLGKHINQETEIVCIFDAKSETDIIATYSEQKEYYLKWIQSITDSSPN